MNSTFERLLGEYGTQTEPQAEYMALLVEGRVGPASRQYLTASLGEGVGWVRRREPGKGHRRASNMQFLMCLLVRTYASVHALRMPTPL
jgi:hypothetical protein